MKLKKIVVTDKIQKKYFYTFHAWRAISQG